MEPVPQDRIDGPEAIRAARSNWRLGQIADAAARLMVMHGYHGMSVSSLAKEAGISVGTIYQYVSNKEDVLLMVIVDILEAYAREVPPAMDGIEDPVERLARGFRVYCEVVGSHRAATVLSYRESGTLNREGRARIMGLELETNAMFSACIDEGIERGQFVPVDTDLASSNLVMLAHMWALKHWHLKGEMDLTSYVGQQLAFVLRTLLTENVRQDYLHLIQPGESRARSRRPGSK